MPDAAPLPRPRRNRLGPRRAITRLGLALAVGAAGAATATTALPAGACALVGWNSAALVLLAFSWQTIWRADADSTRTRAAGEDPGRSAVYAFALTASMASLFAATGLARSAKTVASLQHDWLVGFSFAAVILSWLLTHTLLTLRYAHLYYREDDEGIGGVEFPGQTPPSYFDFAYFAFTIGMCFQVSDTCITSQQIRHTVLGHALLSFAYNTVILAFTLNLVFGAIG